MNDKRELPHHARGSAEPCPNSPLRPAWLGARTERVAWEADQRGCHSAGAALESQQPRVAFLLAGQLRHANLTGFSQNVVDAFGGASTSEIFAVLQAVGPDNVPYGPAAMADLEAQLSSLISPVNAVVLSPPLTGTVLERHEREAAAISKCLYRDKDYASQRAGTLGGLWGSLFEGLRLLKAHEQRVGWTFDVVVVSRPDLEFNEPISNYSCYQTDSKWYTSVDPPDAFWVFGRPVAEKALSTIEYLRKVADARTCNVITPYRLSWVIPCLRPPNVSLAMHPRLRAKVSTRTSSKLTLDHDLSHWFRFDCSLTVHLQSPPRQQRRLVSRCYNTDRIELPPRLRASARKCCCLNGKCDGDPACAPPYPDPVCGGGNRPCCGASKDQQGAGSSSSSSSSSSSGGGGGDSGRSSSTLSVAVAVRGESFRVGGQHSREQGGKEAASVQRRVAASHKRFLLDPLVRRGWTVKLFLATFENAQACDLIDFYRPYSLVDLQLFRQDKTSPHTEFLILKSLEAITNYTLHADITLIFRFDLELKQDFTSFIDKNPRANITNKILVPWTMAGMSKRKGLHRVADTIWSIPHPWIERLQSCCRMNIRCFGHDALHELKSACSVEHEGIGFFFPGENYDTNSQLQRNPWYRLSTRPEAPRRLLADNQQDRHLSTHCYTSRMSELPRRARGMNTVRCCCSENKCPEDPSCIWHESLMRTSMANSTERKNLNSRFLQLPHAKMASVDIAPLKALASPCKTCFFRGREADKCSEISLENMNLLERYGNQLNCEGLELFLTRVDRDSTGQKWYTLIRSANSFGGGYGRPSKLVGHADFEVMSHNAAAICGDGELVIFGGRDLGAGPFRGIMRATAPVTTSSNLASLRWSKPKLSIPGDMGPRQRCIERREGPTRCEFDGKISVVRFRGQLLLFVRANVESQSSLHLGFGGRHLQVAVSTNNGASFGPFKLVDFAGYTLAKQNNIYYAVAASYVSRESTDGEEYLVLAFPAVIGSHGGVWVSFSSDGVQFTAPERIITSPILADGRTFDHPVAIRSLSSNSSGRDGVAIVVEHNVHMPGSNGEPVFVEYFFTRGSDGALMPDRLVVDRGMKSGRLEEQRALLKIRDEVALPAWNENPGPFIFPPNHTCHSPSSIAGSESSYLPQQPYPGPSEKALGPQFYLTAATVIGGIIDPRMVIAWVRWHQIVGVDHFIIKVVDGSTALLQELASLSKSGLSINVQQSKGERGVWKDAGKSQALLGHLYEQTVRQLNSRRARAVTTWLIFLDMDEFIAPSTENDGRSFVEWLRGLREEVDNVYLRWLWYPIAAASPTPFFSNFHKYADSQMAKYGVRNGGKSMIKPAFFTVGRFVAQSVSRNQIWLADGSVFYNFLSR